MTAMRLKRYPSPSGGIALGKMGVGATLLKQGKTAKDYVQDGLIAMWDGIENAGWGVHEISTSGGWLNLVSNERLNIASGYSFTDKYLDLTLGSGGSTTDMRNTTLYSKWTAATDARTFSVECIAEIEEATGGSFNNSIRPPIVPGNGVYGCVCYQAANVLVNANGSGTGNYWFSSPVTLQQPHYICGTWAPSDVQEGYMFLSAYKDGICYESAVAPKNSTSLRPGSLFTGQNWILGNRANYNAKPVDKLFCFRCYERTLTADEIAANYAIDKERFNLP